MRINLRALYIIIACITLAGCRPSKTDNLGHSATPNQATSPATGTQDIPNDTSLNIKEVCPIIDLTTDGDFTASGSLVLIDRAGDNLVSLDLQTLKLAPLFGEEKVLSYAMSPNGARLAYEAVDVSTNEKMFIVANFRQGAWSQTISLPWEDQWSKIGYWLTDEQIVVKLYDSEGYRILILNPLSGKRIEYVGNFPDIYLFNPLPDWNGAGQFNYSPDLSRVVYANVNQEYVLWNTANKSSLMSKPAISFLQFSTKAPQWSPDGKEVLVAAPVGSLEYVNDELFSISWDGNVQRLTNFTEFFPRISINRYSWSPDGHYIAMLVSGIPGVISGERLAVLDLQSKAIDIYCIHGDRTGDYRRNSLGYYDEVIYKGVVWAAKKPQLILENEMAGGGSLIILVDYLQKTAYQLLNNSNLQPVGWSDGH